MTALGDLRHLERWMTYVRSFGVLFGLVEVPLQPSYPDRTTEQLAWSLVAVLALGTFVIAYANRRASTERSRVWLSALSFAFDAAIIMGFVWVYAFERPYVTWALLFILPLEGALRYRVWGALGAAGAVSLFFIPQSVRFANLHESSFDLSTYIFVGGLATLIAGVAGSMAENWRAKSLAFERQSLQLAELDRIKDRFLAVTSHEIRGPLTAVIGGVDTVRKRGDLLTEEQRDRLLEMVSVQGHQLARLVDDLLVTSQLQAGKLSLDPKWADLQATIDQALEAAAPKRRDHQLEVFVEPIRCEIDPSRVAQIVRNLVENAYKYTPRRTRVSVAANTVDGGISIEIADSGPGIPEDRRDDLFEAYSRVEEHTTGKEGVGLGLFVVGQLVGVMDGRIDLASSSTGTSFSIFVPCKRTEIEPLQTLAPTHDDEAST